ncbi:lia operon protein LiaI [Bacillus ectoiniformans]|uniref:lmo0954 family membrane protein n=1 Tax=Bacillus ectoiniformans TaxID=1494429 RepID=UPI00195ED6AF|nr:flagellar basal body rod protein [Bacillus ectoiniformans]MBM7649443.1 lia operon protein LiaI [Bacillus ectoiniformans]
MKKVMLFCIGAVAAIVAVANAGPLIGLALSLVIMYLAWREYKKSYTKKMKFFWGAAAVISFLVAVGNIPAILSIAALAVVYVVYKKWNEETAEAPESDDPFINFEKQWDQLKKING